MMLLHQLDGIENLGIEGQALAVEEMVDGMVVTSISGYPLLFQLHPLRMNNISLSTTVRNEFYKNGVIQTLVRYPHPLAPWIGKSTFDVLLESNVVRNGDLSHYIAMIEAIPDFKSQLELREGDTSATTLFVPTNDALGRIDPSLLAEPNAAEQLVLNHVVSGNFARRFWKGIPTGTMVSDAELVLETRTGSVLNLTIADEGVTLNGHAKIVLGDRFSQQGVLHVIDGVLGGG
jgi:uncharacterized surface protein with fasciclin (FAS1) repeats